MPRFDPSTPAPTRLTLMSQRCPGDQDCAPVWVEYRGPGDRSDRTHYASVPCAVTAALDAPGYLTAKVVESGQTVAILARRPDGSVGFAYPGLPL